MKLKSFRIYNYRSIIDSGDCYLSPNDGITILAGQNESGKSSLLEALKYYEEGTPCLDAYRDEEDTKIYPLVKCTYALEPDEDLLTDLLNLKDISQELADLLQIDSLKFFIQSLQSVEIQRAIGHVTGHPLYYPHTPDLTSFFISVKTDEKFKALTENNKALTETKIRRLLGEDIFRLTPKIILFDDYFDILPDKFYLDELKINPKPKGLQAVNNIETILGTDFSKLTELSDQKVTKQQREYEEKITADFKERWRQRIGDEAGAIISITYQQGGKEGRPYMRFFIQTREGEFLPPYKRSAGFKWFLSFYLHLTAENKSGFSSILLFDEPGTHLHSKAQHDMLRIFEELSKNNQIIYATHSPYLIDADKLHRVRLIFNSQAKGTTIEKVTTKLSINQKDAIKPVIDALGMSVAHSFSAAKDKNVIVEGISDYYYLTAAKRLLTAEDDFYFMPAMGATNAHILMELCIGWGLRWLIIFDDSKDSGKDIKKIKTLFFPNDDTIDNKIYLLKECNDIEDIFEEDDIKLAVPGFSRTTATLSKDLSSHGGKELIGRFFLDKVESGEITIDKLSEKAKKHFDEIFSFIQQGFK